MILASIVLHPGTIAAWIVAGVICGWLAGRVMEAPSYGAIGDLILGGLGGAIGGLLLGAFVDGEPAFWGGILLALVGGCLFIGVARAVAASRA